MNNLKQYESAVKLKNGKVVTYHNINTGLFKFDCFIKEKFSSEYLYYTVRRKNNKEIISTFYNNQEIDIKAVKIYLEKQRNEGDSGFFVRMPFVRETTLINRNIFFSDKIVLSYSENHIVIMEDIFNKAINNAIYDLVNFFRERENIINTNEICLEEIRIDKILIRKLIKQGTNPVQDFP